MADGLEHVAVLSDQLQARGDPRGELLALELAAARASYVAESRRLNEQAQRLRSRVPTLAWPPELHGWRGLIRAGMLVDGFWAPHEQPELPPGIGAPCRSLVVPVEWGGLGLAALCEARSRAGVRLDGLWEPRDRTSSSVMDESHTITQRLELAALELNRRLSVAAGLTQLGGLHTLELGHRGVPEDLLDVLSTLALRRLGLRLNDGEQLLAVLDACPELEQLTLHEFEPALSNVPGLERLRHLTLLDTRPELPPWSRLADDLPLTGLESLTISGPSVADLDRLANFELRALTVLEPVGDLHEVVAKLAKLHSLERLTVIAAQSWQRGAADAGPLGQLSLLRELCLIANLDGELMARSDLAVYGLTPNLRVQGPIVELHAPSNLPHLFSRVDLSQLRTLALPASYLLPKSRKRFPEQIASVETLMVSGSSLDYETLAWIHRLPRLRTVVTRWMPIGEQARLAEELPHVQIVGEDAARLRNEWLDLPPFDPLAIASWPKLA